MEVAKRFLIVCEGQVTEKCYFIEWKRYLRTYLVEIEVDAGGSPKTLVERAALRRKQAIRGADVESDANLLFDEVWCVFDIDEHPDIDEAKRIAAENSIRLAVSNPCFELWALYHFDDQHAEIERTKLRAKLKQHIPGYQKELPFLVMLPLYDQAEARAIAKRRVYASNGERGRNPSTDVDLLTDALKANNRRPDHQRRR